MNKNISACGFDCKLCECYAATQADDDERRKEVAARWSITNAPKLTAQDINCDGCMSDGIHFGWCSQCPIRACVKSKGLGSCAECADFPCENNESLYQSVPSAKETIKSMHS